MMGNTILANYEYETQTQQHERRKKEACFPRPVSEDSEKYRALCLENPKKRQLLEGKFTEVER